MKDLRLHFAVGAGVVAVMLFFVWFFQGTVSPCEILKHRYINMIADQDWSADKKAAALLGLDTVYAHGIAPAECVYRLYVDLTISDTSDQPALVGNGNASASETGEVFDADSYFK